jgi:DNA-binding transcriptional LysR family regulator
VQRRLGVHDFYVVASPGYVEQNGSPANPEDLVQHKSIVANPSETSWRLSSTAGDSLEADVNPIMAADEPFVLLKAAAAGIGITCLPTSVCRGALADGTLVRLLPDWTAGSITTTILMPHRRGQLPSVRAVVDLLLERAGA